MLPNTSSPITGRDVAGAEAAHLEERTTAALDVPRGILRRRVSEEKNSNSAVVIWALHYYYYCKAHSFSAPGINHCDCSDAYVHC
jgi:hypothetical protein